MSLRVWLPLTKDLRNQGLDDVTVTNNGATFNTVGKLGGSYTGRIDVSSSVIPTILNGSEFTVAFWIYINEVPTSSSVTETYIMACGTGGTRTQFHIAIRQNGAGFAFCFYSDDYTFYNTVTDKVKKWMHVVCAFKDNTQIVYVDGAKIGERATAGGLNIAANKVLNIYAAHERLNDVRIYDHALSPLEVKQISQGLILHYPLNRKGWGQENLVNNSDFSNLATTGTVIRDETVLFHGHPTCKISRTGATSNTYTGWSSQDLFPRLTPGTKVTASVWVYRENTHEIDSGCEWRMYQRYNNGASTDWTDFYSASDWPIGEWKRFTHTYTVRSDISGASLSFNVIKNGTYWLAEPKVEIGENVTSWSPSVTDTLATSMGLNSTTEYDCSGFCNNGTRTGIFSWTSDTPKYEVSTNFSTISQHVHLNYNTNGFKDSYSISLWLKYNSTQTNSAPEIFGIPAYACLYISGNLIYWNTNDGTNNPFKNNGSTLSITPYVNNWHHFVITGNGKNVILYIDGMEAGRAITYKHFGGNKIVLSDKDNTRNTYSFIGLVSDFRIYATALSADDVKSLYQNSAYIDNQGNIYGAVYEEV